MKIPKDVHGRDFANRLIRRWGYREVRQKGSHIILRTEVPSVYAISVPAHKPLRAGTLHALVISIAGHASVAPTDILLGL